MLGQVFKSFSRLLHPTDVPESGSLRDSRAFDERLSETTYTSCRYVPASLFLTWAIGKRLMRIGGYSLTYFDEFIDELLTQDRVCDIILPRLVQRSVLEETEGLEPRKSLLVSYSYLGVARITGVADAVGRGRKDGRTSVGCWRFRRRGQGSETPSTESRLIPRFFA